MDGKSFSYLASVSNGTEARPAQSYLFSFTLLPCTDSGGVYSGGKTSGRIYNFSGRFSMTSSSDCCFKFDRSDLELKVSLIGGG